MSHHNAIALALLFLVVTGCNRDPGPPAPKLETSVGVPSSANASTPLLTIECAKEPRLCERIISGKITEATATQDDDLLAEVKKLQQANAGLRARVLHLERDARLDARYRAYLVAAGLTDRIEHVPTFSRQAP